MFRRTFGIAVAVLAAGAFAPGFAADFPDGKPIRIFVATGAGSGSDLTARQIAPGLAKELDTAVIVDNKTGAGGVIATGRRRMRAFFTKANAGRAGSVPGGGVCWNCPAARRW